MASMWGVGSVPGTRKAAGIRAAHRATTAGSAMRARISRAVRSQRARSSRDTNTGVSARRKPKCGVSSRASISRSMVA
jgi:hypothetical protein